MNQQEPIQENNVIYMAEFLMKRRNKLVTDANELYEKAQKLSKKPDPRQDPFAVVLMKKVDSFAEQVESIEKHIKFIVRGGHGTKIPSFGYSTTYGKPMQPPTVSINLPTPPPSN